MSLLLLLEGVRGRSHRAIGDGVGGLVGREDGGGGALGHNQVHGVGQAAVGDQLVLVRRVLRVIEAAVQVRIS